MKMNVWCKTFGLLLVAVSLLFVCGLAASDKLTYLFYGEPGEADPATAYDARSWVILMNVYDQLITYEGEDATKFAPELATDWNISEDGLVYTFYLRDDAVFHDGSPVTAEVVKYSFNRVLTMNQPPAWMFAQMMDLNSTKVLDDYTVEITLTKPYAAALGVFATMLGSIVNPAVVEAHGGVVADEENTWMNQNEEGAGSGPYILKAWIPAERVVFERFDNYWGEKAKIKTIECPIIPEIGTRVLLLRAGDADLHDHFPSVNIPDVLGAEGLTVKALPSFDIEFIVLACRGALAERAVRQAVSYAFPYKTVLQFIYQGYSAGLTGAIPAGMFGYYGIPEENRYQLDTERANQLLDAAGWEWPGEPGVGIREKGGERLQMEVLLPTGAENRMQEALMWQNNLKKIGFDLIIREITWAIAYRVIRNHETDGMFTGWLPDYADPDNYADATLNAANADAIWGSSYDSPDMDALIDQAKWEPNVEKRAELYKQIQELAWKDAPFVWVAQVANIVVLNNRVKGYYYNPTLPPNLASLYIEE